MSPKLVVLFEDNHLLIVSKPAGLLVQGDITGKESLIDLAKAYRKEREAKPGNVYIGLVHRIDRPVSGIVVLAKTSKGASRLCEQFRSRSVLKIYLAVVEQTAATKTPLPKPGVVGTWSDKLTRPDAEDQEPSDRTRLCLTRCRCIAQRRSLALLQLSPLTGRKHQLRLQTSMRGWSIVGDRRYGSKETFDHAIALHAAGIRFEHPTRHEPVTVVSLPPPNWSRFPFGAENYQIDLSVDAHSSDGPGIQQS